MPLPVAPAATKTPPETRVSRTTRVPPPSESILKATTPAHMSRADNTTTTRTWTQHLDAVLGQSCKARQAQSDTEIRRMQDEIA
ncbi:hypothetical protein C2E23DRAFT_837737 [Lenzites betulinus]|nr:hypothetical protein C2E23DRAFT_837737 [Lenzites betulinus]